MHTPLPPDLDPAALQTALRGRYVGGPVTVLATAASTMDVMAGHALTGAPEGAVVITDYQSKGRGRLGRDWLAPPGTALLMSILFRPNLPPERIAQIPMAVALAALEALVPFVPPGTPLGLKWPNDILAGGSAMKLAGLIAEGQWGAAFGGGTSESSPAAINTTSHVIVGLGINVGQTAAELVAGATSLAELGGTVPPRGELAASLLNSLDGMYGRLLLGQSLLELWTSRLVTVGQMVAVSSVNSDRASIRGLAVGVAPDGALRIRTADDAIAEVRAGDVTLAGTSPD